MAQRRRVVREEIPPAATSSGTSTEAMLQELLTETERAGDRIKERIEARTDLADQFDQLQQELEQPAKSGTDENQRVRLRVLGQTLDQFREAVPKEQEDLATAVLSLRVIFEKLGAEYHGLNEPSEDEKKLVADAEMKVTEAEETLTGAKTAWTFRGSKTAKAEQTLAEAKAAVKVAQDEARVRGRERLRTAKIDGSLQEIQVMAERIKGIMVARRAAVKAQIATVSARKDVAFRVKQEAAEAIEKLDADLTTMEAELKGAEEKLAGLENGSAEHAAQSKLVSDLRAKVQELGGRRNTALGLFQSKESFCQQHEVHEITQRKLYDNLGLWITVLQSDLEERMVTFRSWLEGLRAASDQDAASNIDKVGAETDRRSTESMAAIGAISDRVRMERIKAQPERMRDLARVQAAQAEATAVIRGEMAEALQLFREKYGIDPMESSFFSYEGSTGGDSKKADPTPGTF